MSSTSAAIGEETFTPQDAVPSPSPRNSASQATPPSIGKRQRSDTSDTEGDPPKQSHKNIKRRQKRQKLVEEQGHVSTERMILEHVQLAAPVTSTLDIRTLPAASGAYCGKTL